MQVKYIGVTETLVRIDGRKVPVSPDDVIEMSEAEGKAITEGPYRNLYVVEGSELTPKQNTENNRVRQQAIGDGSESKTEEPKQPEEDKPDVAGIIARVSKVETIDELNAISTEVANDEAVSENEEIAQAIEDRMQRFLTGDEGETGETGENGANSSDEDADDEGEGEEDENAVEGAQDAKQEQSEAPKAEKKPKAAKKTKKKKAAAKKKAAV